VLIYFENTISSKEQFVDNKVPKNYNIKININKNITKRKIYD